MILWIVPFVFVSLQTVHGERADVLIPGWHDSALRDLIQTGFPVNDLPHDWDTCPPEPGEIRLLAEILLGEARGQITEGLAKVPDGPAGKGSPLYQKIGEWNKNAQEQLIAKNRTGLLTLNSIQSDLMVMAKGAKDVDPSLMTMAGLIQNTGKALVYNVADVIAENPNPNKEQLQAILACFYTDFFVEESEWEEEAQPIDPAGMLVLDPSAVADLLKAKSANEIRSFLGGYADLTFFERYEEAGDGMATLKAKYAANKAAIHGKFAEMLAHVAALEAVKDGK